MSQSAIEVSHVHKSFERGKPLLSDVSLKLARGEMVALIGASGSGKSTLIRSIAGLISIDKTQRGSIRLLGEVMQLDGRVSTDAKSLRSRVGVVFQQFNLVARLSLLTNVLLGLLGRVPRLRGCLGASARPRSNGPWRRCAASRSRSTP